MAQITNGIRSILSNPYIYSAFQSLFGGRNARQNFVNDYVKPFDSIKILDIGCGPADIFEHLQQSEYYGFDISETYIKRARVRFNNKGIFICKKLEYSDLATMPKFDLVLGLGLIHHLDDTTANQVLKLCHESLKIGGRLITMDPCLVPFQNPIARFLINKDRGQNVRNKDGYENLVKEVFPNSIVNVRHQTWIPYTHCIIESVK